ncbi:MAG: C-GCAxxG-C-C family protein [Firmicutes bacterium]|jgi:C_GCAxxG_C_C family probable redox protein|nr:C-GCAxxG-C-C family protein [Bacillota bacterium]MDH7495797.1 C-GCAxxG-C-C family protein [Bacillota bacterium]
MARADVDVGRLAVSYFDGGFNCAEATLKAVCDALGLEHDRVPAAATAFGGGLARRGYTCGAVSGAALAVGLAMGRMSTAEARDPSYSTMGRFVDEFVEKFGTVMCKDISGVDFRTEEGQRRYKEYAHTERCCPAVRFAAEKICELLAATNPRPS